MKKQFDYAEAFSRNIGWITSDEQKILQSKTIGIAGLGGVGGYYAEALTRLGISSFVLADFDQVDLINFNRQQCATMENLGRSKIDVVKERILSINPDAKITLYPEGLKPSDLEPFVRSIDLYLDGLDFFVLDLRAELFKELRKQNKIGITVAPLAMGASMMVFSNSSMSFEDYFGFSKCKNDSEKAVHFLLGIAPSMLHQKTLVYPSTVNFRNKKGPSNPAGVFLCAGVACTEVLKHLINRGPRYQAPWVLHFDAFQNKYKKNYVWGGYRSPWQKFKIFVAKRILGVSS